MQVARVLADFKAETEEELSLVAGCIVDVLEFGDDGWAEILYQNRRGICPNDFLQIEPEDTNDNHTPNTNRPLPQPVTVNNSTNSMRSLPNVPKQQINSPQSNNNEKPQTNGTNSNRPLPQINRGTGQPNRGQRGGNPQRMVNRGGIPNQRGTQRGSPNIMRGNRGGLNRGGQNNRGTPNNMNKSQREPNNIKIPENVTNKNDENSNSSDEPENIEEEILSPEKIESMSKHRRNVVTEILNTEKDYVKDIEIVARVYIQPLATNDLISREDHALIFSNLEVLVTVNQQLLDRLTEEVNTDELMIGNIFSEMVCKHFENDYKKLF